MSVYPLLEAGGATIMPARVLRFSLPYLVTRGSAASDEIASESRSAERRWSTALFEWHF
jgi:hypothetical protein